MKIITGRELTKKLGGTTTIRNGDWKLSSKAYQGWSLKNGFLLETQKSLQNNVPYLKTTFWNIWKILSIEEYKNDKIYNAFLHVQKKIILWSGVSSTRIFLCEIDFSKWKPHFET